MPGPKLGVRQLSLQGTGSPTPSAVHRGIRRQLSDNDFLNLRIGPEVSGGKDKRNSAQRPKPTSRLAWTEPSLSEKETGAVEVVARRCVGLPRPARPSPKHTSDLTSPTREQLAERLRRAWRGRSQHKNLDIYLTHSRPENPLTPRPPSEPKPETLHERNKIEINLGVEEREESSANFFHVRNMSFTNQESFNKENVDERGKMTASERRASFKTSQLLNRTITGSFSDDDVTATAAAADGFKIFVTRPPLLRTSSAPTERNPPTIGQVVPKQKVIIAEKKLPPPPVQPTVAFDYGAQEDSERIQEKNRRKAKSYGCRRKPKERSDSSEDEELVEDKTQTKKLPRRRQIPRPGAEIITMVSLVSPAESDNEEPPLLPTGLVPTLENEKPDVESQPEPATEAPSASFILHNLRKTVKTAHPPVSRSCSASFPLRRVPPGAPIIVPVPITAPVQDGRGIKRRLIRAKTAPIRDEEAALPEDTTQPDTTTPVEVKIEKDSPIDDDPDSPGLEPIIKSPKEKECWALYKKMVDKGVAVSYDTILRGMLTPTEYRLRQNQLSRR